VTSRAIDKYLARHAEPEARSAGALAAAFGHGLVVPAYGEADSLFSLLGSVPGGPAGPVLIVVVLNARKDSPPSVHEANTAARERLARTLELSAEISADPPIRAYSTAGGSLVLIDRAAAGRFLPEGQGVGLARKIGNDFVLALFASGRLSSSWIHNTDADTVLPADYFGQIADAGSAAAAALYFFEHRFEQQENVALAARLYDISLRYYVLGLAWAGSPYAYQSMGSCLAIAPEAYAAVRGFPKKNAAEDFYVLNKLAKVGAISRLAGKPVVLEGRVSDRVPFGTGRAVGDLVASPRRLERFPLYHPLVFAHLAGWLEVLEAIARSGGALDQPLNVLPQGNPFFRADLLEDALRKLGAFEAIREAASKSRDAETLRRHLYTWFDAFRTRKLIHALRDGGLSSLAWREALAEAPFTNLSASTEDNAEALRQALASEERKLSGSPAGLG
jgi:hypothetical protein